MSSTVRSRGCCLRPFGERLLDAGCLRDFTQDTDDLITLTPTNRLFLTSSFVDFFPLNDPLPAVQEARNTGRSAFAVDYTYCPRKGELTISGVPGSDSHSDSELQIVDPSQTSTEETNYYETETETETEPDTTHTSQHAPSHTSHAFHASHSAHATHATHTKYANTYNISALLHSSTLPYISAPFILRAKAGDQDGINLPSFPEADATLLYWEIHRDVAELPLRVRVVNESTVQIWPDSKFWVS